MQRVADGTVKTQLFLLKIDTLEEDLSSRTGSLSLRNAHASSGSYRPPKRQRFGGPDPMDLS